VRPAVGASGADSTSGASARLTVKRLRSSPRLVTVPAPKTLHGEIAAAGGLGYGQLSGAAGSAARAAADPHCAVHVSVRDEPVEHFHGIDPGLPDLFGQSRPDHPAGTRPGRGAGAGGHRQDRFGELEARFGMTGRRGALVPVVPPARAGSARTAAAAAARAGHARGRPRAAMLLANPLRRSCVRTAGMTRAPSSGSDGRTWSSDRPSARSAVDHGIGTSKQTREQARVLRGAIY
jgi:hypothetical protein